MAKYLPSCDEMLEASISPTYILISGRRRNQIIAQLFQHADDDRDACRRSAIAVMLPPCFVTSSAAFRQRDLPLVIARE